MCGIIGWVDPNLDSRLACTMRERLAHRGPDDTGNWRERDVWLGQRRLSIVDLSATGHQPMSSRSGRFVITYNGEIYNHVELRLELEGKGHQFLGHSDTEVLLEAFEAWGIEDAVARFNGMFAFGVWDRERRTLWLARDRLGEKPIYYAESGARIAFASELRALWPLPWLDRTIDRQALSAYFRFLCVPAPATIIRGVRKLAPGALLHWRGGESDLRQYWSISRAIHTGKGAPLRIDYGAAVNGLETRLRTAIRMRLRSDVPYGAFLSGGIDSSVVAALMQQESPRTINTFTIGFDDPSHDESPHARAVAKHLGTNHHEAILSEGDVASCISDIANFYDEPFADSSSVPTYLLAQFARRHVTVALSGDGGDELFGGYPRYFWAGRIETLRDALTPRGTRMLAAVLQTFPASVLSISDQLFGDGRLGGAHGLASRVRRFAAYLRISPADVYNEIVSAWARPSELLGASASGPYNLGPDLGQFPGLTWAEGMMAVDQSTYLPDDILTKVDRATMAVSLEARAPLLDHNLVEWCWRLPVAYKLANTGDKGKLLLRSVLDRHVPANLIDRPKMGFGMPIGRWLREGLREWAENLLAVPRLQALGLLNVHLVRTLWERHLAGEDHFARLWTVLMFVQWQEKWRATS